MTAVVCKVMEALIKKKMTEYQEESQIMNKCQHGFTRGRSCLTNLLESFESWTRLLDEGLGIDVV